VTVELGCWLTRMLQHNRWASGLVMGVTPTPGTVFGHQQMDVPRSVRRRDRLGGLIHEYELAA
jgi:hypothetical protein